MGGGGEWRRVGGGEREVRKARFGIHSHYLDIYVIDKKKFTNSQES